MSRLTAQFWVDAYRRRLDLLDIPCFITRRGDPTGGAVYINLNRLDGRAQIWQRRFNLSTDTREWAVLLDGSEAECAQLVAREASRDPDLWVIEVEDRSGRHLLDDPSLA